MRVPHYIGPLPLVTMYQTARSRNRKIANCSSVAMTTSNNDEQFHCREFLLSFIPEYFVLSFTSKTQNLKYM